MKNRNWFLPCLLLLIAAALLLRQGEQRRQRELTGNTTNDTPAQPGLWERFTRLPSVLTGRKPATAAKASPGSSSAHITSLGDDRQYPFRVRNTSKKDSELFRSETAVLMRNALIETLEPATMNIPAHLRAQGDPGSYLVQARGTIDDKFRAILRGVGAEIVSYVPNNTYLVRASANDAQQLRISPRVQSVLPFEPFYKLDMTLLPLAVRREAMPAGRWLNLVLFSGTQTAAMEQLRALGAEVKGEQPFPFGHVVTIAPPANSLVAIAQLSAVQNIETYHSPILMNDLSRVRLDVSTNTTDVAPAGNWLSLTGNGVTVGVIGSGVDLAHTGLMGRMFANTVSATTDVGGHDTFVAGLIAANHSTTPAATNGSIAGGSFRGIASGALLFPLSLFDRDYTNYGNVWLITNSALATDKLTIVNNSWGYPVSTYDINSALFDEAVRDSLPFRSHDQPITHVFAAGNSGGANSGGTGGAADTIASPGNGKNVITVGASELLRFVPNSLNSTNFGTNDPIAIAHSDSLDQVADFSSRGNVGVGIEGTAGRFKPDLVAPGAYLVSLRASTFTNLQETDVQNMLGSSQWRYDSGSSFAAAKVSGVLALMQEFFAVNHTRTNKPSLNKALLINRAQSLGPAYDLAVNNPVTHQGWGIPSLSNTVPSTAAATFGFLTNSSPVPLTARIVIVDESSYGTNHLASGQYHSYNVAVSGSPSQTNFLKITLAWTDPAGNPISSAKLVNDLDLYVTNLVAAGSVYEGNNFAPGTTFTQPTPPGSQSQRDAVNNVENIFIPLTNTAATTYRIYVIGRKVNVNAVSGNTNQVAQDYSLVISTDQTTRTVGVQPTPGAYPAGFFNYTNRLVNIVTNGLPYLNERVGANPGLFSVNGTANANTNGVTNQWNFYVFTNQNYASATATNMVTNVVAGVTNITTNVVRLPITNGGPYVTLSTFLPPNLARSRIKEADVDMYVTRSSLAYPGLSGAGGLTNLDPQVLSHANTLRSTNRGGYELIAVTNSSTGPPGEVFFVGIKSEDQQGGQYGFLAAATQLPSSTNSTNGGVFIDLFPVPAEIPDGSPEAPGGIMLFGICTTNITIQSLSNSLTYVHENLGDLVGTLTFNGTVITLNNHTISPTAAPAPGGLVTNVLTFDDFRNPPDGPGDVTDLIGQDAIGLWIFEVYDNAPFQTGSLDYASIYIRPYTNAYSTNTGVFYRTVALQQGQSFVDFLDIPTYATNLDVDIIGGGLAGVPGPAPQGQGVDLLAGSPGFIPSSLAYSIGTLDLDNSDSLLLPHLRISSVASLNLTNSFAAPAGTPSLTPGRWNFRIINNSAGLLTLTIRYTLGLDLSTSLTDLSFTNALAPLFDNSVTNLFITAGQDRVVAGVDVGLAIKHPRVSDLVIHLISPSGTKVLLFEDRYGTNGLSVSNLYANFSENTNFSTHIDTNGYAALGFHNLGYLMPMKFIPAPFSAVISPPLLFTNATNLTFGYRDGLGRVKESPSGMAQLGGSLFMAGVADRNNTKDGFLVSYQTPILTNVSTNLVFTQFIAGVQVSSNLISYPVTNFAVTNFWTGPFSGYRGAGVGGTEPQQTFFNGVAVTADGVVAVGQTRNWFPPVLHTWSGTNSPQTNDVDLGCTSGTIQFTFAGATANRMLIEYQGLSLMDANGTAAYSTNIPFSGASRFMRITANPTAVAVGSTWSNTLTVLRSGGVSYAVSDYVSGAVPGISVAPATLSAPRGVALDSTGNVYVADSGNGRILRLSRALTIPFAGTDGTFSPLSVAFPVITGLSSPGGVAINSTNGDIYVADTGNHQVKRFSNDGTLLYTWGAAAMTAGSEDSGAPGFPDGRFNGPQGLALSNNAVLLVADTGNNVIRQIGGVALTTLTTPVAVAPLSAPRSVLVAGTNVYVADTGNNRIKTVNGLGSVLAGSGVAGSVDGVGLGATFSAPSGITRDGYGNFYVSDAGTHRIRRVTPLGQVETIAGSASGNSPNAVGTLAQMNTPRGLAADHFGAIFIAEGSANNSVKLIGPYQTRTPTNSFVAIFPFNGPTNAQPVGTSAVVVARGITDSVFGLERSGADSRETFNGVASSSEGGTNFFYAVGSAQFSTNSTTTAFGLTNTFDRMFLTKFGTNGQPIWTRGHMAAASIGVVTNGGPGLTRDITSLPVAFGGSGYTAPPYAVLFDPLNLNPLKRTIALTVTVAGGAVTLVTPTVGGFPIVGPFVSPRVYIEAPQTPNMPGNAVAVAYGTNVIAAGFTNIDAVVISTNNVPFLMCLEATNGMPRWALGSTNAFGASTKGHYNSVAVSGDRIIAVGAGYSPGVGSTCLMDLWSLTGSTQNVSFVTNYFGLGRTSFLSQVIAIESLDRAYAVGSVINANSTWDAFLMEIDLTVLAGYPPFLTNNPIVSVITNNITNFTIGFPSTNIGKAITTDGVDLYVAVEGPGENQPNDRQAAVFRYRAKNFYLPEESLNAFVGERTWNPYTLYTAANPTGTNLTNNTWRLQVADTRAGGTNGTAQVVSWNLNFSYAASNTTALTVSPGVINPIVLLSSAPQYFRVPVPSAAGIATNLVTASGPVRVTFHPASLPLPGAPGTKEMFSGASTGSFLVSTNTNSSALLRPGSAYYLGIQALNPAGPVNVSLNINFDQTSLPPVIPALADGTPLPSFIPRTTALNQFKFTVPANASAATFELLNANGDVNLYLLRSNSPTASPGVSQFDFRSANPGTLAEQIFVVTNGTASSLTPGIWFLGVQNADNSPVNFTVRATSQAGTPYNVVTAADAQPFAATTTPGNAPNSVFKLTAPASQKALLFEVRNLTGPGDLVVRRGTYPVAGVVDAAGTRPGALPEVLVIRTNGALPNLTGDWYFGVVNPGSANVSYTVMARQPTNGVLLSGNPIQIVRSPASTSLVTGTNFGFDLEVVPGEKYQVQYRTNLATGSWLVLTNITATSDGLVSFLHSGALSNRNLYYRIQVVP